MNADGDIWKILLKELCLQAYAKGYKQGYEEGYNYAKQEPIRNLITRSPFTDEQIAAFTDVTANYVSNIRKAVTQEE